MKKCLLTAVAAVLLAARFVQADEVQEPDFELWKSHVAAGDSEAAAAVVDRTRERGPGALQELLKLREQFVVRSPEKPGDPAPEILPEELARLNQFIDAVGGQRYCTTSKLFWYTDLQQACEVSRKTGKPILSLRLLGHLTDELSCANSRFFRTTLYANENISNYLREHFVLHWESVRPAPVMTIDFGDGRRIIRTVTGNSVHYVLDEDGHPLDALPGLYGPQAFLEWLQRVDSLGDEITHSASTTERAAILDGYHERRRVEIERQWQADLSQLGLGTPATVTGAAPQANSQPTTVPAEKAAAIAVPKGRLEARAIPMITMSRHELTELTDDQVWREIAALHAEESELDAASRRLIFAEVPQALTSDLIAVTKSGVERRSLVRLFSSLRASTALDSVRNEYELHLQIHDWFLQDTAGDDVVALNSRVYAELFLTPDSDPWLGLFDPTAYTGLSNAGIETVTP